MTIKFKVKISNKSIYSNYTKVKIYNLYFIIFIFIFSKFKWNKSREKDRDKDEKGREIDMKSFSMCLIRVLLSCAWVLILYKSLRVDLVVRSSSRFSCNLFFSRFKDFWDQNSGTSICQRMAWTKLERRGKNYVTINISLLIRLFSVISF